MGVAPTGSWSTWTIAPGGSDLIARVPMNRARRCGFGASSGARLRAIAGIGTEALSITSAAIGIGHAGSVGARDRVSPKTMTMIAPKVARAGAYGRTRRGAVARVRSRRAQA